jgi:hypothetical protein
MKFLIILILIISCGGREGRRDELFKAPVSSPEALVCEISDTSLKCELPGD